MFIPISSIISVFIEHSFLTTVSSRQYNYTSDTHWWSTLIVRKIWKNKIHLCIEKYSYTIKNILSANTFGQNRKCNQTNALENKFFH